MNELIPAGIACLFHIIDTLAGIIAAVKHKEVKSAKMRDGLFKKCGFLFCYAIAYIVDHFGKHVGIALPVNTLDMIVIYAISIEMVSIIETITKLNPDILPEKLQEIFSIGGKHNG